MIISNIDRINIDDTGYVWSFIIRQGVNSCSPTFDISHRLSSKYSTPLSTIYNRNNVIRLTKEGAKLNGNIDHL